MQKNMTTLDIHVIDDPVLRRKAKKVVKVTPELRQLLDDMVETMRVAPGVGLAAPQVGVSERVIVVEYAEDDDEAEDAPPPDQTRGCCGPNRATPFPVRKDRRG
jgi:peptide deformylase